MVILRLSYIQDARFLKVNLLKFAVSQGGCCSKADLASAFCTVHWCKPPKQDQILKSLSSYCEVKLCFPPISVTFPSKLIFLSTKSRLLYLKTQFVPRSKHLSFRLQKPISLCCKWHKSLFVLR